MKMNNEVARIDFTEDQVNLIRSLVAPKATNNELQLFLYQCKRTGLDPLTRQIYAIHRKSGNEEKMTIQTSIDGFRVIAERSGVYAGQSEPFFIEQDGQVKCCKITVRKFSPSGEIYDAAVGVAYWDEYAQTKDEWKNGQKTGKKIVADMWAKMPHTMLAKVAEALALRKAFPQDLSGLYTSDEMQQADKGLTTIDLIDEREAQYQRPDEIGDTERDELLRLLGTSTLDEKQREMSRGLIAGFKTWDQFNRNKIKLLQNQAGRDGTANPSYKQDKAAMNRQAAMDEYANCGPAGDLDSN